MSISKIAVYAKYLIIPIITWGVSLLAAEVIFRQLGDRTTEDKQGYFMPFNDGNFKLLPQLDVSAKYASGPFSVHTDSLGLRCDKDRKHAVQKGDAVGLLFIGDSQGFGNGVNFEDTIPGAVAEIAYKKGSRVANASVGGHGALNQLELVRWLRNQQNLRVARYVILLTPVMLTGCDSLARASVGQDGRLYDKPKSRGELAIIWLKTHSVTYARVRDVVRNMGIGVEPSKDVPFVFRIFDASSDEEESVQKLMGCLAAFREIAADDGATLSVVYTPLTIEAEFDSIRKAAEAKGVRLDPDLPMRIWSAAATRLGIPAYNIRSVLQKAHSEGRRLNLKADFHYEGNVSKACAQYLWREMETSIKGNGKNTK
jgi:hypothetical protein